MSLNLGACGSANLIEVDDVLGSPPGNGGLGDSDHPPTGNNWKGCACAETFPKAVGG